LQWEDKPNPRSRTFFVALGIEVILLLPLLTWENFPILVSILAVYHAVVILLERNKETAFLERIIELLFLILITSTVFGIFETRLIFNGLSIRISRVVLENNILLKAHRYTEFGPFIIYLFAILILINEMNNFIRLILARIKTEPQVITDSNGTAQGRGAPERTGITVDSKELSRGKIIGVIERILFFFFVITGNYSSIAFILAAKGFTRFRELDNRNFAEYVLIGTLLSSALSIFWAYLFKRIIQVM
jgi:hypothetical protein